MALLLDRQTIQGLLDMDKMIGILEQAFGELASGSAVMPQRAGRRRRRSNDVELHCQPGILVRGRSSQGGRRVQASNFSGNSSIV